MCKYIQIDQETSLVLGHGSFAKRDPVDNYMFKVNNRNTITRCEICSKLTIKTPERRQWPTGMSFKAFKG